MTPVAAATQVSPVITSALQPWQDDLIFDIGMNTGQDTEFYLAKGFRVVAVEANPSQCKAAAERYGSEIAKGRLTIVNRAISEDRSPLLFYVCESYSAWSTASPRLRDFWQAREGAVFTEMRVDAITTADLISEFGVPHYAKIDIEGFDLICLNGLGHSEFRPKYLSFEVDFYNVDQMIESATKLGYSRFALVSQKKVPQQTQPRPAREGLAIDYSFVEGCSGLFGRELPTDWLDVQALRLRCNAVMRQYRAFSYVRESARILPKTWVQKFQSKHLPLACDWYDMHAAL
jgi:FkbM family methyltransferase